MSCLPSIPPVLIGTSPFIGAGQFGPRARAYYERFYCNPSNIAGIIKKACGLGVRGVQLLPFEPIVQAVMEASAGEKLVIVGTVRSGHEADDVKLLAGMGAVAMVAHAEITDRMDERELQKLIGAIRDTGALAGLATHRPKRALLWLDKQPALACDVLMLPVNMSGAFMDCRPASLAMAAASLGKHVIAKKVLAAGRLPAPEAIQYAGGLDWVHSIALGVTSEEEAAETFGIAMKYFLGGEK